MSKLLKASVLLIILIVLSIYLAGFYYFGYHFLPNTIINGKNFGFTQKDELMKNYDAYYDDFKLSVETRDGEFKISSKDIDYKEELLEEKGIIQNPFYWFFYMLIPKEYDLKRTIDYDDDKLNKVLANSEISGENVREPQDAKIVFDDGNYKIEKEVEGNKANVIKLKRKVIDRFNSGEDKLNLERADLYYKPQVLSDDKGLNDKLHQINKINDFEVIYDFKDRKEVLKNEELVNLYSENEEGLLVPNIEKVEEYVKTLSQKYDTFRANRNFYATDMGFVVVRGGIYGWSTDILNTTKELVKILEHTTSVTVEPIYRLEAMDRSVNDLGNSYVEIDLGRQHMWLYRDGNLVVDSDIVSGNPTEGNGTPVGTGKIWSRETNRYLTGEGWNSHVDYWLPFNWSGCGIHDSSWRSEYGKDIYLSKGSHGCVNTPSELMKTFYDNTFHGMPVVVYDSSQL
ncbi:MAG: L,D-transpeptidase family protein [Peptoniphilus sp.]|nr:L,D-transpeptidase family protein [Peptoniphilus sp.]